MRICEEHGALNCSSCYIINELESEINSLKSTNAKLVECVLVADNILMAFNEYHEATDRRETSKSNTKWHTFERILYDRIKLSWLEARQLLAELESGK